MMLEQPEANVGQGDVVHRLVWLLRVVNGLPKNFAQLSFDAFAGLLLQALRQKYSHGQLEKSLQEVVICCWTDCTDDRR